MTLAPASAQPLNKNLDERPQSQAAGQCLNIMQGSGFPLDTPMPEVHAHKVMPASLAAH